MVHMFQFGRDFFTRWRRGVLGSRGSGLGISFCSGGGLGFCEGVNFFVNLVNLQFEGGLDAGWHSGATS